MKEINENNPNYFLGELSELPERFMKKLGSKQVHFLNQLRMIKKKNIEKKWYTSLSPEPIQFKSKIIIEIQNSMINKLDLSELHMKILPVSIGNLKFLKELYIMYGPYSIIGNPLKYLPKSIGKLKNLEILMIEMSKLKFLPETIGNLTSLKKLSLFDNEIYCLPESIGNLTSLRDLDLFLNHIENFPTSFSRLKNLHHLSLEYNRFESLPQSILALKRLKYLNLEYTPISRNKDLDTQNIISILKSRGVEIIGI